MGHIVGETDKRQKRRRGRLMLLALALSLCIAGGVRPDRALAQRAGNTAVTALPGPGGAGGVRLRAQTVDVSISEDGQGVRADTSVSIRLSNPFTRSVTLALTLPGPQLTPGGLPADLQIKLGDSPLPVQPAAAPASGLAGQLSLLPQGEATLSLTYRQELPESGGLVTFAYPLAATRQWSGTPESLRVTVDFAGPVAPDQLLALAPEPDSQRGQAFTWSWDSKPGQDIWLAFLAPSWWSKFAAARTAAAAPAATPAQHVALFQMYQQLSQMPKLAFKPDLDFYSRYYPAAVGELQAATAPQNRQGAPSAEEIAAHGLLARLYQEQADRLGRGGGDTYLELAAAEAQAALSLGASGDQELLTLARNAYLELAARARAAGDVTRADGYLARLAALEPASRASSAAEEQKAALLALAGQQVARGDLRTARTIVAEAYGADAIDIPALRAPLAGQALVTVETRVDGTTAASDPARSLLSGQRTLRLTLADSRDPAALRALLREAAQAWQAVTQVTVTSGDDWLAVDFAFQDDQQLGEIQGRLARLMPPVPELALLESALQPSALSLRAEQDRFQRAWRYSETTDLTQAAAAWQNRAREVRAGGDRLAAPIPTPAPSPSPAPKATAAPGVAPLPSTNLGQIQRVLWSANADEWTKLAGRSYTQYSVQLGGPETARQWQVPAGAQRTLQAEDMHWNVERVALVFAGAVVAILLVAFLLWRLL